MEIIQYILWIYSKFCIFERIEILVFKQYKIVSICALVGFVRTVKP